MRSIARRSAARAFRRVAAIPVATAGVAAAARVAAPEMLAAQRFNSTEAAKPTEDDDVVVEPVDIPSTKGEQAVETEAEVQGTAEEMGFKTETRQLLDIVACSLYSDKEVFIRELVSNASDALEKRRHLQVAKPEEYAANEPDAPPSIQLHVNQSKTRFIIQDTGIGMSKEELAANLGTIASSGSKAFVRKLQAEGGTSSADKIIGQFGVGFYSAFMVARHVKVFSRSAQKGAKGYLWESDGTGTFKIAEAEGVAVGTKIVLDVKDTELSFCTPQVVERVIKKYSNFVEFEIALNGGKLNTIDALWMKSKNEISNEEHIDFYKFVSGNYDSPSFRLHYSIDAPLTIRALLYVPQGHAEKYGGGRMESGVNLYCRRVLIQSKAKGLLPEWLRFIKGAVDSESIPLNISREHTQDSGIMRKLSTVLTKRVLKWLGEEAKRDRSAYEKFFKEFGSFLKEGVCTDQLYKADIAKLLRFATSKDELESPLTSLDEYKDRMQEKQSNIYYLTAPSRDLAMASPYYEQYREHGLEVLIMTEPIDEFVMNHLETFAKHKLQSIETFDAAHDGHVQQVKADKGEDTDVSLDKKLTDAQCDAFCNFIQKRMLGRVGTVKATDRLRDSPAMLADHESAQMRRLYRMAGHDQGPDPKYNLHFNPKHELVRKVYALSASTKSEEIETAGLLVEQLYDNAVIAAGLLDDPRSIVGRLNSIMTRMVKDVEEPKREEPKAEEPKAEEPKAAEPKAEEPKAEELKTEEAPKQQ